MGLDQYVYAFKGQVPQTATDFGQIDDAKQIFYWRKHPNLDGWMSDLYYKKGGNYSMFNGNQLLLTQQDIQNLQTAQLPNTTGFFFGTTQDYHLQQDQQFIAIALQKISQGYNLFYVNSW